MLQERFHALDGYALDAQVGAVLTGLGFGKEDWARQTDEFSGGWQMRIALAKLLLAKPNLLLLDEPTNHLDLETRNWLEDYLKSYPFGYILISHDRYFLDVTIDRTVEIWNKRLTIYQGNYTKYLSQKDERRAQLEAAYRNQREQIEHLEAFINRFRAQATKAKQVQSRIKELEKIERIEIPEEEPVIHFKFPQPPPSGRMVVEAEGLAKSYGAKQVFSRRALHHRARRPRGAGGRERRGQVDADQAAHRRRDAHRRHSQAWATTWSANTLRRTSTRCSTPMRACSTTSAAPRVKVPEVAAALAAGLLPLLGRRCLQAARRALGRRAQPLRAGAHSGFAFEFSAARRAHQPPGHARQGRAARGASRHSRGTVVFVSHDRYFIDRLATRVLEVENGDGHQLRRQLRRLPAQKGATGPAHRSLASDVRSGLVVRARVYTRSRTDAAKTKWGFSPSFAPATDQQHHRHRRRP